MKHHPNNEKLMGFEYGLLSAEEADEVRQHLGACRSCSDSLVELVEMERHLVQENGGDEESGWFGVERLYSVGTPIAVMGLCVLLSAFLGLPDNGLLSLPLLIGALLVTIWLHALVSRSESRWREVSESDLSGAGAAFVNGLRISAAESLKTAQTRLRTVLVTALLLTALGMVFLAWATASEPELTSSVLQAKPDLIPGAIGLGLLLGGSLWSSWRLTRLARDIADRLGSLVDEGLDGTGAV